MAYHEVLRFNHNLHRKSSVFRDRHSSLLFLGAPAATEPSISHDFFLSCREYLAEKKIRTEEMQ